MIKHLCFWACTALSLSAAAQTAMPQTDIYILDLAYNNGKFTASNVKPVANKNGYENQPYFTPDGEKLYYVAAPAGGKTDVWLYDVRSGKRQQVTKTPKEAEYSPKAYGQQGNFTVIRVEENEKDQHLFEYSEYGKPQRNLLPEQHLVGYYNFLTPSKVATFILPEPFTLELFNIENEARTILTAKVGRCFQYLSRENQILYIDKSNTDQFQIKAWDFKTNSSKTIAATLEGEEDFCTMNDGSLLMGHKGKLYRLEWKNNPNASWQKIADLTALGINNFYRLVLSPQNNKLALVNYTGEKP
jgi:hypothetical protein